MERNPGRDQNLKQKVIGWLRRREVYAQDKLLGVAEMNKAIHEGRNVLLTPALMMHITEVAMMIHKAGKNGIAIRPKTTFSPIEIPVDFLNHNGSYLRDYKKRYLELFMDRFVKYGHR